MFCFAGLLSVWCATVVGAGPAANRLLSRLVSTKLQDIVQLIVALCRTAERLEWWVL
jgi:hypothetical protein